MKIRLATKEDLQRIIVLWEQTGLRVRPNGRDNLENLRNQIQQPNMWFYLVEKDRLLVGVVLITHDSRKGWINRLAVHPDFRREGIGEKLLQKAEKSLLEKGINVFSALIEDENIASRKLFEKNNYRDLQHIRYYAKKTRPDI